GKLTRLFLPGLPGRQAQHNRFGESGSSARQSCGGWHCPTTAGTRRVTFRRHGGGSCQSCAQSRRCPRRSHRGYANREFPSFSHRCLRVLVKQNRPSHLVYRLLNPLVFVAIRMGRRPPCPTGAAPNATLIPYILLI